MKKGLFANYKFFDEQGKVRITEEGYEDIMDLADIVIAKHFYLNSDIDKEDLKSIGILKVLELLNEGNFDPTRSSLKNYCYTGMRNEMKNHLYRSEKLIPVEDEILATNVDSVTSTRLIDFSSEFFTIRRKQIRKFLGRFPFEEQAVVNSLLNMGFSVEGGFERVTEEINQERVAIIQCLVIWDHLEHSPY